jgi:hypothetical protein
MLVVEVLSDEHMEFVLTLDSDEAFDEVERLWWRLCASGASNTSLSCRANMPFCSAAWNASKARLNWFLSRFWSPNFRTGCVGTVSSLVSSLAIECEVDDTG